MDTVFGSEIENIFMLIFQASAQVILLLLRSLAQHKAICTLYFAHADRSQGANMSSNTLQQTFATSRLPHMKADQVMHRQKAD